MGLVLWFGIVIVFDFGFAGGSLLLLGFGLGCWVWVYFGGLLIGFADYVYAWWLICWISGVLGLVWWWVDALFISVVLFACWWCILFGLRIGGCWRS